MTLGTGPTSPDPIEQELTVTQSAATTTATAELTTTGSSTTDTSTPSPTALVVLGHHRSDSLSAHVADRAVGRLTDAGYTVDFLDLHAENFDPRMTVADQPEWGNRDKVYSPTAEAHMRRLLAADVVVVVFPVYWQSVPALLKGWIDAVWNYGFAYGRSKPRLAGKRILWLGLAGATADDAIVPGMQQLLEAQLNEGLAYYSGFADSRVGLLPDAEEQPQSLDAEGNLVIGEAISGDARTTHYAAFDAKAEGFVDALLTASRVAA
ncbi:NAD(P)H oxidoreductase [Nocardia salmonicida]|uniref:NAD(P)H oxidoreductase n=1 Tax=Nocardia salmonicida TaxID=53431 RepID=UPI00366D50DD